jgi:hypothetical protein
MVYPNPVRDVLKIDGVKQSQHANIELYSLDNKIILNTSTEQFPFYINVNDITSNGVYFLKIATSTDFFVKKIFVQK